MNIFSNDFIMLMKLPVLTILLHNKIYTFQSYSQKNKFGLVPTFYEKRILSRTKLLLNTLKHFGKTFVKNSRSHFSDGHIEFNFVQFISHKFSFSDKNFITIMYSVCTPFVLTGF